MWLPLFDYLPHKGSVSHSNSTMKYVLHSTTYEYLITDLHLIYLVCVCYTHTHIVYKR